MHEATGTNGTAEAVHEASGTHDPVAGVLETARANVAAAQARIDQLDRELSLVLRKRDAADDERGACAQEERDEHARHRTALDEIGKRKATAITRRDKARDRVAELRDEIAAAQRDRNRYRAVVGVMEAERAPRARTSS